MASFSENLNEDFGKTKTPARHDSNAGVWMFDSAIYTKNQTGVWVPVSSANPMPTKAVGSKVIATGTKTIGISQVALFAGAASLANRKLIRIKCEGNDAIFIGPAGVTKDTGYPLIPGQEISMELDPITNVEIYAIALTNQNARIWEEA